GQAGCELCSGALQRLTRVSKHVCGRIELCLTRRKIVDDPVHGAIEIVTGLQDCPREELLIRRRKTWEEQGLRGRCLGELYWRRGDRGDLLQTPELAE